MPDKGSRTRAAIIDQAAQLFNTKGYAGCSMGDVMEATGLKKGGIYNHFGNKDSLALAAFDYAIHQVDRILRDLLRPARDEREQLLLLLDFYRDYPDNPIVRGGCPLLNTIIDSDDTHPELKQRARHAMQHWIRGISGIIERGQAAGLFEPTANAQQLGLIILASIEGGIALGRLGQASQVMAPIMDHLTAYLRRTLNF